jgi:hypothetical protein
MPVLLESDVAAVQVDPRALRGVARAIGLKKLPQEAVEGLKAMLAAYKKTSGGSRETTPANVCAAIDEIEKRWKGFRPTLDRFVSEQSGIDSETRQALREPIQAHLDSWEQLSTALSIQRDRLSKQKRVSPRHEAVRLLCPVIRGFFRTYANPGSQEDSKAMRKLAMVVFPLAGISIDPFVDHPARLDKLLQADSF